MSILRTNQIQDTSGNTAMMIDDSGVVNHPAKPFWVLGLSTNAQVEGTLAFDVVHKLRNATHNSGAITILTAGVYLCTFASNNDNTYKHFNINGSNPYASTFTQWHNGADSNTLVTPLELSVNDVVTCYMGTAGGGTYGHNTLFSGVLIG